MQVSDPLRNNGIAKDILASAAKLAIISDHGNLVCYPGLMGSFVWLRLGGVPKLSRDKKRITDKLETLIEGFNAEIYDAGFYNKDVKDVTASRNKRDWLRTIADDITSHSLTKLTQSKTLVPEDMGRTTVGMYVLEDIVMEDTYFDLNSPTLIKTFQDKNVLDIPTFRQQLAALNPTFRPHRATAQEFLAKRFG